MKPPTDFSRYIFSQNVLSTVSDRIVNTPLTGCVIYLFFQISFKFHTWYNFKKMFIKSNQCCNFNIHVSNITSGEECDESVNKKLFQKCWLMANIILTFLFFTYLWLANVGFIKNVGGRWIFIRIFLDLFCKLEKP